MHIHMTINAIDGIYTNSTETVTQEGEWHEGVKNSLFIEKDSSGQVDLCYENGKFVGGSAYKRPRHMALFFNSYKKRTFKVKNGILLYYTSDGVEKGHVELANYDVFLSGAKQVACEDPYSIVLRKVTTAEGLLERREIVLNFEEWKLRWPQLKEMWIKLIKEGVDYSYNLNFKESHNAPNAFSQVYQDEAN